MLTTLKYGIIIAAALCVFARGGGRAEAADPAAARVLYLRALGAMSDLKQPAYVTYRLEGHSERLEGDLVAGVTCLLQVKFGKQTETDQWNIWYRTSDDETEILDSADDHRYVTDGPAFDPTWNGSYRSLTHERIYSYSECNAVPPQRPSAPAPMPSAPSMPSDARLRTIATVTVLGPGIYNIEDRGGAACPDGDAGRALHLWSRTKNPSHQLSDVIIDLQSTRFCMVRFGRPAGAGLGAELTWEVHYRDVGGYWMETDGSIEATERTLGIAGAHGIWRFHLLDMQFPDSLPSNTFATPATPADTQKGNVQ